MRPPGEAGELRWHAPLFGLWLFGFGLFLWPWPLSTKVWFERGPRYLWVFPFMFQWHMRGRI